jgi:hypothetical protein
LSWQPATTPYLERIYFHSVVYTPHQFEALVRVFGADHVLMGSDYRYDMGDSDPIGHLASLETLDPSDLAAIAGGNAKKLFSLQEIGNRTQVRETRQGFQSRFGQTPSDGTTNSRT